MEEEAAAAAAGDDDVMIDITSGDDDDVAERELIQAANKKPRTSAPAKKWVATASLHLIAVLLPLHSSCHKRMKWLPGQCAVFSIQCANRMPSTSAVKLWLLRLAQAHSVAEPGKKIQSVQQPHEDLRTIVGLFDGTSLCPNQAYHCNALLR